MGKKEALGNYRLVSLTLVSEKVMKQQLMESVSRLMKSKEGDWEQPTWTARRRCFLSGPFPSVRGSEAVAVPMAEGRL